ncbi:MAG: prepilin peptidase [Thermofilum sp.]
MIGLEVLNHGLQAFLSVKTLVSTILLCHAAFQDLEGRRVEASAWFPLILLGVLTLMLELTFSPLESLLERVVSSISLLSLFLLLGLYGLGDALILAGLGLAHVSTTRPLLQGSLLQLPLPEFSLTVLLNAEILSSAMMVSNIAHNLRSGAWRTVLKGESFRKRLSYMLLFRAVGRRVAVAPESCSDNAGGRMVFVKQTVPMVLFILLGYVATLFFGSIIPMPC